MIPRVRTCASCGQEFGTVRPGVKLCEGCRFELLVAHAERDRVRRRLRRKAETVRRLAAAERAAR